MLLRGPCRRGARRIHRAEIFPYICRFPFLDFLRWFIDDLLVARWLRCTCLPDILHETMSLLAQQPLHPANRIALAIKKMTNTAEQIDVLWSIITAAAAALHWPDLVKTALPEPQDVLRNIQLFRDLADGAECVGGFIHVVALRSTPASGVQSMFERT